MPQPVSFAKCACQHCGGHIEFPIDGAGQKICCPHCDRPTLLSVSKTAPVEVGGGRAARKRIFRGFAIAACVLAAAAVVIFHNFNPNLNLNPKRSPAAPIPPTAVVAVSIPPPKPKPPPDPWHGLKAGPVTLEPAADGHLVYAIGTLTNDTPRQRFGVKVELDVLDEYDKRLGAATDYTDMIEPGKTWKFRAMVTDKAAAAAKLTNVKEQK
jgi:hypothetical protein